MNNERTIRYLVDQYPNLYGLSCEGETLKYQNQSCVLTFINVQNLINKNSALQKDLPYLSAQDFFHILYCHAKSSSLSHHLKEAFSLDLNPNIKIKNLRTTNQQDKEGFIKTYIYFIDEQNQSYIIENYSPDDILNLYYNLREQKKDGITIRDLQDVLKNSSSKRGQEITFLEYLSSISQNDSLNLFEKRQLEELESYIYLLYQYQKYLMPSVHDELIGYQKAIQKLEQKENKTEYEINTLKRFTEYFDHSLQKQVLNRSFASNNQLGYFNGFILIGIIIMLGVILSILLIIAK